MTATPPLMSRTPRNIPPMPPLRMYRTAPGEGVHIPVPVEAKLTVKEAPNPMTKNIMAGVGAAVGTGVLLWILKPKFILRTDETGQYLDEINTSTLLMISIVVGIIAALITNMTNRN